MRAPRWEGEAPGCDLGGLGMPDVGDESALGKAQLWVLSLHSELGGKPRGQH